MDSAQDTPSPILALPGLKLHVHGLSAQHMQRSQQEISLRLGELTQQVESLEQQMTAARDLDSARREKDRLDKTVRDSEAQILRFDELQELKRTHAARSEEISGLSAQLSLLETQLAESVVAAVNLRQQERRLQIELDTLCNDHLNITRLRENRRDDADVIV